MHPLKGRRVLFGALAVLACSGDPTENEGTPTEITASPDIVFVTQGDSQPVIASVVDEDGQIIEADINATNAGGGISVTEDPTFLTVNQGVPIARQHRFFVRGVDLTATSFTLEGAGLTKTIQVTSVPGVLAATISDTAPALGDTISITAPAGTFFSEASVLTFDGAAPVVVSRDAATIVFIPFPNITAPAVVSEIGVTSNPALTFTLSTPDTVRTDSIHDVGAELTPTAPALGQVVTLTLPAELRVIPESLTQSGVGADTVPRGLTVAGAAVRPRDISVTPDSLTISFIPAPNSDSVVEVPGVIARRLPQYPLLLSTTVKVTTAVVDSIPATLSTTTPAANATVTLTRTDPSFVFDPDASVIVGADPTPVVFSVAGDGSSITFLPTPGSTGNVSVDGATIGGFSLTLPSQTPSITVGALTAAAGTDDPATAPSLPVPGAGESSGFWDIPDFQATLDHFYKLVVTEAGVYTVTMNWDIGDDVDMFLCPDPGTITLACDFQAATGDHPEVGVYDLAPGTFFLVADDFGGGDDDPGTAPALGATVQIRIDR